MSYRNKTYIIFDGDKDMWAYRFMRGWKASQRLDFNFHDAHDLNVITDRSSEETVKRSLRTRFSSAKQAIVLIGENTKNLFRFVRWEIDVALGLDLPIVAVNLNKERTPDYDRCPAIIRDETVVHVAYQMKIIQYALDDFPLQYSGLKRDDAGPCYYSDNLYRELGL